MLEVLFCECGHQEIGCPQCMGAVHRDDNTAPPRIVCDECQWSQPIPEAFRQETVTLTEVIINGLREEVEL